MVPFVLFGRRTPASQAGVVDALQNIERQHIAQPLIGRFRQLHGVRRGEHRNYRHGDDDGVDEIPHNSEAHSHSRDDEAEFAQLGEAETGMQGVFEAASGQDDSEGCEKHMGNHHHYGEDQYQPPVLRHGLRSQHHAHRHEEYGAEQVFDWGREPVDMLALDRLGQDGAHHERTEGRREARSGGQGHHAETEAEAYDEQDLVVQVLRRLLEYSGNEVDAQQEPQNDEEQQLAEVEKHLSPGELVGYRQRAEQHHEEYGDEVLEHQGAEHRRGVTLLSKPHFTIRLDHHHGARHAQEAGKEDALHGGPHEGLPHHVPYYEHSEELAAGRGQRRPPCLEQLLEAEFEAEAEHEEDDADIAPELNGFAVADAENAHFGTYDEPGYDISQDRRLLEGAGDDSTETCGYQDDGQIPYKIHFFSHYSAINSSNLQKIRKFASTSYAN